MSVHTSFQLPPAKLLVHADKAGLQVSVDAVKELLDACKALDPSLA